MMDLDLVPNGSMEARCDFIFQDAAGFCEQHGFNLHLSGLTKTLLGCATSADFPTALLGCITTCMDCFDPLPLQVSFLCCGALASLGAGLKETTRDLWQPTFNGSSSDFLRTTRALMISRATWAIFIKGQGKQTASFVVCMAALYG